MAVVFELFQFSAYFLSNMILQCMTIYLYWEKPVWLWCQYWIRPNIAANTKNPGVSQNHEKSSYRTDYRVFIITIFKLHILAFYDLFWFLNANPSRTNQGKQQISWKNSGFVDSGFVKTCGELVIERSIRWKVCSKSCPSWFGTWYHGFRKSWTLWSNFQTWQLCLWTIWCWKQLGQGSLHRG